MAEPEIVGGVDVAAAGVDGADAGDVVSVGGLEVAI